MRDKDSFALRLRSLVELGYSRQEGAFGPLVAELSQERETHWRLALLDTLFQLPAEDKITPLLPLLAEDQPGDGLGIFLCGLTWFLGKQGPGAIEPLTYHLLAKPGRARRIKDGLLAEAFFLAAEGDKQLLTELAEKMPPLYRFCSNRLWPKDTTPHYGIYPNPDYLLQIALREGLSQSQFKALYYRERKKTPLAKPPFLP